MCSCSTNISEIVSMFSALKVCEKEVTNEVTADHSLFDLLPDDCLINVFSQLDVVDRLRSEAVCKRWQLLSKKSWRDVTSVDIEPSATTSICLEMTNHVCSDTTKRSGFLYINTVDTNIIRHLLSRCGRNATYLSIFDRHKLATDYMVSIVAECCHNVTECRLSLNKSCEIAQKVLLVVNKNIRQLKIFPLRDIRCLHHLRLDSLKELELDAADNLRESFVDPINEILPQCTSLCHLHLNFVNEETLEIIGNCIKGLEYLSLDFPAYDVEKTHSLLNIAKLTKLETLRLYYSSITDDVMYRIVEECKELNTVRIGDCLRLTETGIMTILTLPKLMDISFFSLPTVTDEVLMFVPQTVYCVYLNDCLNISDDGVISFIRMHPNLRHLVIGSCDSLTSRMIRGVVEATEEREEDDIVLRMVIFEKDFNDHDIAKINTSPFLDIIIRGC